MDVKIESEWKEALGALFSAPYFADLAVFLRHAYTHHRVYPAAKDIFAAFAACSFSKVRVVILGQDPYHGPGQAHGMSFSVPDGVAYPPSLQNIFKEIEQDIGAPAPTSGNLMRWATQGVLLLNAVLTVRAHSPNSHSGKGWEHFTDEVLKTLSDTKEHIVFMLWGSYAQRKGSVIDASKHLLLSAPHPSPLSANKGFFGCKHFSKANEYLQRHQLPPIQW